MSWEERNSTQRARGRHLAGGQKGTTTLSLFSVTTPAAQFASLSRAGHFSCISTTLQRLLDVFPQGQTSVCVCAVTFLSRTLPLPNKQLSLPQLSQRMLGNC